jgi:hypothetical protein
MIRKLRESDVKSRIYSAYSSKLGPNAAETEFEIVNARLWSNRFLLGFVGIGMIAIVAKSWPIGFLSIVSLGCNFLVVGRIFYLRHRFFVETSKYLKYPVNWRHPVRGVPTWRRKLSDEKLEQLDKAYREWCQSRGVDPHR